jgi:methionyl-tRNA formyltransferase
MPSTLPLRIVFFSSSYFVVPLLESIHNSPKLVELLGVVTQPDTELRGKILKNPIATYCKKYNIPCFQPEKINTQVEYFAQQFPNIDLCIVASFGQIISEEILVLPKFGCINWHPSELPKYRGATPIQTALINGDTKSALSWIQMTNEMDAGDIIQQEIYIITLEETFTDLATSMCTLGIRTWPTVIKKLVSGEPCTPQNNSEATFCKKIKKVDCLVHPELSSAVEIYNQWRAYIKYPGTKIYDNHYFKSTIKLINISLDQITPSGDCIYEDSVWIQYKSGKSITTHLKCANNTLIKVLEISLENGKRVNFTGYIFR